MDLLLALQALPVRAAYGVASWLVDTGLLGIPIMALAMWPALKSGFYPEGIQDADELSQQPDQTGEGATQESPDPQGETAYARHKYDDDWRAGEDTD